ncbi:MAG: TolC family protein [Candidatus Omnitrophica bacterium]|nr:TolC family protein [Candidatus Omnitrophota bacterium]
MLSRAAPPLLLLLFGAPLAHAQEPLTLAECYALARKRSETVAIQQELIRETQGRFVQALSTALPSLSFNSSDKRQDGAGTSAFTLRDVPERKFVLSQPLFSGFREFAAIAGSRAEQRQRTLEKQRAEHLLLGDVADAFYLLREQRAVLGVLELTRSTLLERLEEMDERVRLGRSRSSEIASLEAELRRVEAQIIQVRGREATARQLLEFLTGLEGVEGLDEPEELPPAPEEEASYVARAKQRPDVLASFEAWEVARKEVTVARADLWPDVDVDANYYVERAGAAADVAWDATLTVDVPLFEGGKAVGNIRSARARAEQARLAHQRAQRSAALEAGEAHTQFTAALARVAMLRQALEAAQTDYRLQLDDYRLALVNVLDVLETLQTLQQARQDLTQAAHEAKRLHWQLRIASGEGLE